MTGTNASRSIRDDAGASDPPRRTRWDWPISGLTLLLGAIDTTTSGLGWPALRAAAAIVFAAALLQRRRFPLVVLVVMAATNVAANVALRAAGHAVLLTGLAVIVAIYALARWAPGRHVGIGLGVVAAHAISLLFVDPNSGVGSVLLLHGGPALVAYTARARAMSTTRLTHQDASLSIPGRMLRSAWRSGLVRVVAAVILVGGLFATTQGTFIADQLSSYVTRTRSPDAPTDWHVEAATLRRAAEASRGTHTADGAVRHSVDYPYQLLSALESPTASAEVDVTVIDGTGYLQHDPRVAVGLALLEFLEYAAIADFPIIKLDLKRDRVDTIIREVEQAVEQFGLDPSHVHFNADVFRGPGVENDAFGARSDKSVTDRLYNLVVMELETSDLVRIAETFPGSTIVISSTTPTGPLDEGYSQAHLEQFVRAAEEVRQVNPDQSLAFAVRGDLAAQSAPQFLAGLADVDNSYVAAWWSTDPRPTTGEIETLRAQGVTFFDLGEDPAGE